MRSQAGLVPVAGGATTGGDGADGGTSGVRQYTLPWLRSRVNGDLRGDGMVVFWFCGTTTTALVLQNYQRASTARLISWKARSWHQNGIVQHGSRRASILPQCPNVVKSRPLGLLHSFSGICHLTLLEIGDVVMRS